jgi:hypothetical protein
MRGAVREGWRHCFVESDPGLPEDRRSAVARSAFPSPVQWECLRFQEMMVSS